MEDASQIIIRVLDLHHPLTVEQPLHQYSKRKRQTMTTDTQLCNHDQKSSDCKTQKGENDTCYITSMLTITQWRN